MLYSGAFIVLTGVVAACAGFSQTEAAALSGLHQLRMESGWISGTQGLKPGVQVFEGIPFAAPPVGKLRWRAPQPPAHWTGVRNCGHFAAICPQKTDDPNSIYYLDPGSQRDCLYLNVWTSAKSVPERLPVTVWTYGGAFDHGSGAEKYYWGDDLAYKGAVVVTFNYRVGVLGFRGP